MFDGLRVLEFSQFAAGPLCSTMLADFGADVVKIENLDEGDALRYWDSSLSVENYSYCFFNLNRNKRGLAIDLKKPGSTDIMKRLVSRSDVLVESSRPGVMKRLSLGCEEVCISNPRLIYCSISGYGQTGPYAEKPGFDAMVQAESGMMTATGIPGGPPVKIIPPIGDVAAGLFAAFAVAAALYRRQTTGKGERIDVSLLDSSMFAVGIYSLPFYFGQGKDIEPQGTAHPTVAPYEGYQTLDSRWIMIGAITQHLWQALCQALKAQELLHDERFATVRDRNVNRRELVLVLQRVFMTRTRSQWLEILNNAGVPCVPINKTSEAFKHPQLMAREMLLGVPFRGRLLKVLNNPAKFASFSTRQFRHAPLLGEHTREILLELGYDAKDVENLRERGVVSLSVRD